MTNEPNSYRKQGEQWSQTILFEYSQKAMRCAEEDRPKLHEDVVEVGLESRVDEFLAIDGDPIEILTGCIKPFIEGCKMTAKRQGVNLSERYFVTKIREIKELYHFT
jgi:hypothetical protein